MSAPVIEGEVVEERRSIIETISKRYNMEAAAFQATVMATCFPASPPATREEFAAGMQVAYRLNLNPLTKEIHFARTQGGGIQAIIGVDGWYKMANDNPQYDGCEFDDEWQPDGKGEAQLVSVTCRIFRKDRSRPTAVTEYMAECRRGSQAWKLTPSRMLRHRAFGQCARVAFSFAGIMDADEFARWQEEETVVEAKPKLIRKSSAEGKRDGSVKRFNDLRAEFTKAEGPIECMDIWKKATDELASLPSRWFQTLAEDFVVRMGELGVDLETDDNGWPVLPQPQPDGNGLATVA